MSDLQAVRALQATPIVARLTRLGAWAARDPATSHGVFREFALVQAPSIRAQDANANPSGRLARDGGAELE
jgi:hypothetical protein